MFLFHSIFSFSPLPFLTQHIFLLPLTACLLPPTPPLPLSFNPHLGFFTSPLPAFLLPHFAHLSLLSSLMGSAASGGAAHTCREQLLAVNTNFPWRSLSWSATLHRGRWKHLEIYSPRNEPRIYSVFVDLPFVSWLCLYIITRPSGGNWPKGLN